MNRSLTNNPIDAKPQLFLERATITVLLAILAVRVFAIESTNAISLDQPSTFTDMSLSLWLSFSLLLLFVIWLVVKVFNKPFNYRFSFIEIGLAIFAVASAVSAFAADNKRAAITDIATMLPPILASIMLVQILSSPKRIEAVLYAIAAVGSITAVYSLIQYFWVNAMVIEQYRQNPNAILNQLGIAKDSFQQMLFEHSLYSRDVKGFFTTGNSAGSFAILTSFASLALFVGSLSKQNKRQTAISAAMLTLCLAGLIIPQSKGAIAAFCAAVVMLIVYLAAGKIVAKYKNLVFTFVVTIIAVVIAFIVSYGTKHGTLPGGNSMLVRWQYWTATAKMSLDHPLKGIGGGNFASWYPYYKNPAALETVADPHNFLLSLSAEYGFIGTAGFIAAFLLPILYVIFAKDNLKKDKTTALLIIATAAFILHNCIDFAIFEPAIYTTFWLAIAVIVAADFNTINKKPFVFTLKVPAKISIALGALLAACAFVFYALIPVTKVNSYVQHSQGCPPVLAQNFLIQAENADTLSPDAAAACARMYLTRFYAKGGDISLLKNAESSLLTAIKRNPADFKNYQRLSETYNLLAEKSPADKNQLLAKAFDAAQHAVIRYPGNARLHLELAGLAEQLNDIPTAIAAYKTAVGIEDAYRKQFQIMYPGREIFSRLGSDAYNYAKQKIQDLSTKPQQP